MNGVLSAAAGLVIVVVLVAVAFQCGRWFERRRVQADDPFVAALGRGPGGTKAAPGQSLGDHLERMLHEAIGEREDLKRKVALLAEQAGVEFVYTPPKPPELLLVRKPSPDLPQVGTPGRPA